MSLFSPFFAKSLADANGTEYPYVEPSAAYFKYLNDEINSKYGSRVAQAALNKYTQLPTQTFSAPSPARTFAPAYKPTGAFDRASAPYESAPAPYESAPAPYEPAGTFDRAPASTGAFDRNFSRESTNPMIEPQAAHFLFNQQELTTAVPPPFNSAESIRATFGTPPNTSAIKKAVMKFHPDKGGDSDVFTNIYRAINNAYESNIFGGKRSRGDTHRKHMLHVKRHMEKRGGMVPGGVFNPIVFAPNPAPPPALHPLGMPMGVLPGLPVAFGPQGIVFPPLPQHVVVHRPNERLSGGGIIDVITRIMSLLRSPRTDQYVNDLMQTYIDALPNEQNALDGISNNYTGLSFMADINNLAFEDEDTENSHVGVLQFNFGQYLKTSTGRRV